MKIIYNYNCKLAWFGTKYNTGKVFTNLQISILTMSSVRLDFSSEGALFDIISDNLLQIFTMMNW